MGIKIWSVYEAYQCFYYTEIMDKLSKHEIDCFVSVEEPRWEESEISPITSIGETEIYFAINPNVRYQKALDSAMHRIKDDNPFYTDDLYRRYLSAQSLVSFKRRKGVDRAWSNPDRVSESGWRYQQCRSINRQTDRCYHTMWILQKIVCKVRLWNLN